MSFNTSGAINVCDPFGIGNAADQAKKDAQKAAALAKRTEEKRQADILQGNQNINSAFAQYDPAYYERYKDTYKGYYNPQIDLQYDDAKDKLIAALAGRGTLGGTVGNDALAKAFKVREDSRTQIGSEAEHAAHDLGARVENQKTNLYALNQSAADPQGIMARATGAATALAAPPAFSQLGQIFASALQPYMLYQQAYLNSPGPAYRYPGATASGRGSGTVVR